MSNETGIKPTYRLILGNTYYTKGFFNLGVDIERHLTYDEGPMKIFVGDEKQQISGRITRKANQNGTPRIYGGAELRDWFQTNCRKGQLVNVVILAPKQIWIKRILKLLIRDQ